MGWSTTGAAGNRDTRGDSRVAAHTNATRGGRINLATTGDDPADVDPRGGGGVTNANAGTNAHVEACNVNTNNHAASDTGIRRANRL